MVAGAAIGGLCSYYDKDSEESPFGKGSSLLDMLRIAVKDVLSRDFETETVFQRMHRISLLHFLYYLVQR